MAKTDKYVGIHNEVNGGMTTIGKLIRDAWVFGIIPETESCEGWNYSRVNELMQQVDAEWDKYGCMVRDLPDPLRERHERIHGAAIAKARTAGWSGEFETDDEQ
ncbi:MAG TPA: hypothetical protein ENJ13_09490 [Chromatiales bacterium]|nr:hypothetical protein [Chromatiales bacterium]